MCSSTIYKNSYNNHNFPIFRRRNMDLWRRRKTNEDIVYQSVWTNFCPCKPGPNKKAEMRIFSVQMYFVYKYMYNVNQLHFLKHHITWKLIIYSIPLVISLIWTPPVFSVIFLHIFTDIITGFLSDLVIGLQLFSWLAGLKLFLHYGEGKLQQEKFKFLKLYKLYYTGNSKP